MAKFVPTEQRTSPALRDFEALSRRDAESMAACYAPDAVVDFVPLEPVHGRAGVREFFEGLFAAVPDLETTYEVVAESEEVVVVTYRMRGTFSGAPFQGIEPTGRPVEVRGCDVLHIEGDHIVHNTAYYDALRFSRQIGMLPAEDSPGDRAMMAAFNAQTKLRARLRRG